VLVHRCTRSKPAFEISNSNSDMVEKYFSRSLRMHESTSSLRNARCSPEPIHPCAKPPRPEQNRSATQLHRHAEPAESNTPSASKPNNPLSSFHHAAQTCQAVHSRAGPVSKVRLPPPSTTSPLTSASRGTDLAPNRSKDALSAEPLPKSFARAINAAQVRADFRAKRKLGEGEGEDGPKRAKRRKVEGSVGEAINVRLCRREARSLVTESCLCDDGC
jgi:hypothetical protein